MVDKRYKEYSSITKLTKVVDVTTIDELLNICEEYKSSLLIRPKVADYWAKLIKESEVLEVLVCDQDCYIRGAYDMYTSAEFDEI